MFSVPSLFSEEQFQCSICLDVFTDPVTIPCGHNFCKNCITCHWDVNERCECPLCKDVFKKQPELRVNTFISEMARQVKMSTVMKTSSHSVQKGSSSGEVLCDICSDTKLKALKSCLTCLASYCDTHLEPHHRISGLRKHQLMDPVEDLEDRICKNHGRPLEMFCKTDQRCVCHFCIESSHKTHIFVQLMEEYKTKKIELGKLKAEIKEKIQMRQVKIERMKQLVKDSKVDADGEIAASVQVFTALIQSAEKSLAQLLDLIEEKHKKTETQAEGFIRELEEEISELMKSVTEVEQLSHTEDHLQFLQNFSSLSPAPPTKDWTEVRVHSSYEWTVRSALAQIAGKLSSEISKMCTDVDLKRVQQYAVDVTLDPETASPYLILSDDEKQVKSVDTLQNVLDNPRRFTICNGILGKQSFSSGKFYFEVQVKGKTDWDLGVAAESVVRNGKIRLSPKNGFWTLWLRNGGEYKALAGPGVLLCLKSKPQAVGVFVDYEGGVVSFYDADKAVVIYSFTHCNFSEKLFPYFSPCSTGGGINVAPLILRPLADHMSII